MMHTNSGPQFKVTGIKLFMKILVYDQKDLISAFRPKETAFKAAETLWLLL